MAQLLVSLSVRGWALRTESTPQKHSSLWTQVLKKKKKKRGSVWCKISWLHRVIPTHHPVLQDFGLCSPHHNPVATQWMWRRVLLLTFARAWGELGSSCHGEAKPLIGSLRAQPATGQSHTYPQGSAPSSPGPSCPSVDSILPPGTHRHFGPTRFPCLLSRQPQAEEHVLPRALPVYRELLPVQVLCPQCLPLYFLPSHSKEKKCYPNTPSYDKITPDKKGTMNKGIFSPGSTVSRI